MHSTEKSKGRLADPQRHRNTVHCRYCDSVCHHPSTTRSFHQLPSASHNRANIQIDTNWTCEFFLEIQYVEFSKEAGKEIQRRFIGQVTFTSFLNLWIVLRAHPAWKQSGNRKNVYGEVCNK